MSASSHSLRDESGTAVASRSAPPICSPAWLALQLLGVAHVEGRMAHHTWLGEQLRTAVARAIVLRPSLVVLDEPTSHQDDEHVDRVLEAFLAVRKQGTAMLVASHDERVMDVADRTVRLVEGRVVS